MKLKEYMDLYNGYDEITCWDNTVDSEFYFYKKEPDYTPDPDFPHVEKLEDYLINNLEVQEIKNGGIIVNLYDLLDKPAVIDFAKENLFNKFQYETDEDVVMLLFDDMVKNISDGYERFSGKMLRCFEEMEKEKAPDITLSENTSTDKSSLNDMIKTAESKKAETPSAKESPLDKGFER